jgi:hypothetical protein
MMTIEKLQTKANTEFMDWWKLLNAHLALKEWPQAGFSDAKGCYEMGESPEAAARQLILVWSTGRCPVWR